MKHGHTQAGFSLVPSPEVVGFHTQTCMEVAEMTDVSVETPGKS